MNPSSSKFCQSLCFWLHLQAEHLGFCLMYTFVNGRMKRSHRARYIVSVRDLHCSMERSCTVLFPHIPSEDTHAPHLFLRIQEIYTSMISEWCDAAFLFDGRFAGCAAPSILVVLCMKSHISCCEQILQHFLLSTPCAQRRPHSCE